EDECPPGTDNEDCDTFETIDTEIQNARQVIALSGGPFHRVFGGPPGVPENRANIIREALDQAINDEDLRAEAEEAGRPITYGDAETTRQGVVDTIEAYRENQDLLREAGLLN
ncbi:MAG: hypothetical protein R3324_02930, partial [Halobacteriales archaeon]|nr:hypothetical protein [Halobacteriales archaeon]